MKLCLRCGYMEGNDFPAHDPYGTMNADALTGVPMVHQKLRYTETLKENAQGVTRRMMTG